MKNKKRTFSTKSLVCCALLAALSIVMARFLSFSVAGGVRWSADKFPLFLAGLLFGPVFGSLTGFTADFIGSLMQFGFNPLLSPPAILYGLFGGLLRYFIIKKPSVIRLAVSYLFPVLLGSILYQSCMLAYLYPVGTWTEGLLYYLGTRSVQFSVMLVVEVFIIFLLLKTKVFNRLGVWPSLQTKGKKKTMDVNEAIAYIESVSWKGSVPGLERTQELLARLGNPEKHLKYVHIAGTNGKGSTAAMTASILRKAGYKTGLYTSPHIYRFHERIQVNGVDISDEDLAAVTEYVKPFAETMADLPTEFELVFCIAAEYFKRVGCDIVVLEVGMGGAMDATNVIPVPEVAVITNIGLDHTGFLGDTVEEIATEKCGIFKDGGSAVAYRSTPGVEEVFHTVAAQHNVSLKLADFDTLQRVSHSLDGQVFDCGQRKGIQLPLLGDHQLHNASVVLSIADTLIEKGWKITEAHIYEGIRDVRWPGRFDIAKRDPLFIIDGGHNPQCLEALVNNIRDYLPGRRIIGLTGVLADKDYADMYKPVMPYIEQFVCITPPNDRKLDAPLLAEYLQNAGAKAAAAATIPEGVKLAQELAGDDGVVLCFGSLYSIGTIRNAL